jgi:membrane-associated protein
MDLNNFADALAWVIAHGYPLMFIIMMIEGPVITAAAAFASALGYYNIYLVLLLSIFADWITDIGFYVIGYYGRKKIINRFGPRFGMTARRMAKLESLSLKHEIKAMLIIKLSPLISFPGLVLMGAVKMPLKRFALYCFLIILPYCIFFASIGFYFGMAYDSIMPYVKNGAFLLVAAMATLIGFRYLHRYISSQITKDIEKI